MSSIQSNVTANSSEVRSALDVYIAEYNQLRDEVLTRLEIRERSAGFSLTVQGILLAIALGAQPVSALTNTYLSLTDVLLLSPIVACVFQATLLRQTVRVAMIAAYLLTDLNERVVPYMARDEQAVLSSGAFGWLTFQRRMRTGTPLTEWVLTLVEFNMALALGLFGLIVYIILTPNPFTLLFFGALSIWGVGCLLSAWIEWTAFQMHMSYTSPKNVVRAYLNALTKKRLEYALEFVAPSVRIQEASRISTHLGWRLGRTRLQVEKNELPSKSVVTVRALSNNGAAFMGRYDLEQLYGVWYITSLHEELVVQKASAPQSSKKSQ
jgi:hypothetical protein